MMSCRKELPIGAVVSPEPPPDRKRRPVTNPVMNTPVKAEINPHFVILEILHLPADVFGVSFISDVLENGLFDPV